MNNPFKVGDTVTFVGGDMYGLSNSSVSKYSRPECDCIISSIKLGDQHPYSIRTKGKGKRFHGWVDAYLIYK